ncbi:unnamed protein product [marine sediment metagenome]|uniref:Uncharacterized protein n=1 Tax=marine sediment metagenome TaxID=412755 RepID=X1FEY0_9ZZZZ
MELEVALDLSKSLRRDVALVHIPTTRFALRAAQGRFAEKRRGI